MTDSSRIRSIDVVRGAVMALMALDHVRVYAAVSPWSNDPATYFTRWITNFCAPAFVFLAGTGAYLKGERLASPAGLSRYLAVRGALLVFLELTISRLGWTFNLDFWNYTEANVLWAIGWAMLVLAVLVRFRAGVVTSIGIVVMAGHHLLEPFAPDPWKMPPDQLLGWLWQVGYVGGEFRIFGGPKLVILYTLIPWIGVMAAGYGFGQVMRMPRIERDRWCRWLGGGMIVLFLILRTWNLYGDTFPWSTNDEYFPPLLSFLWTNKYPASLQFLLMTLGPVIALLPVLDRTAGRSREALTVLGREPLFFYLLHIPFIHAVTVLISLVRTPDATWWLFENHPLRVPEAPAGYVYSLPLLYAVWVAVVIALWFATRWYARLKERKSHWLFRYI